MSLRSGSRANLKSAGS